MQRGAVKAKAALEWRAETAEKKALRLQIEAERRELLVGVGAKHNIARRESLSKCCLVSTAKTGARISRRDFRHSHEETSPVVVVVVLVFVVAVVAS